MALTNGSFSQMTDTFVHAGLRWTLVLSADLVRTFKPAAAMYGLPPAHLQLSTDRMLFVAAHPWDLDAAATRGYRTALIRRPGTSAENDDRFDLSVATIGDLADLVAAGVTPVTPGGPQPRVASAFARSSPIIRSGSSAE